MSKQPNKERKTLLITHNYNEESFAFMSYSLANYLANQGNRVIFISHKPFFKSSFNVEVSNGELKVYSWPTKQRPTKFSDAVWFAGIYLKYKPSSVVSHFGSVNITIIISKLLSFWNVRTYPYYHTLSDQINQDSERSYFSRIFTRFRKFLVLKFFSDAIICPSDFAKTDLENYLFMKNGRKVLNPMRDRFVGKVELNEEEIKISFLGRIDASKGILKMIEAFNEYFVKFPNTKIKIQIAGEGSLVQRLKDSIIINRKITYKGALKYNEIDEFLNDSHFLIIPSLSDNLPTVGLEAMMNQTALLISNSTGLTQELEDGIECFKFEPNIESIISVFEKIEKGENMHTVMGVKARETFLRKFGVSAYWKKMEEIIC